MPVKILERFDDACIFCYYHIIYTLYVYVSLYIYIDIYMSKMNAVACAQLTFQMLTSLQKYLYRLSQYSKPWDRQYLALIAQMVRAFGMNPKVGGSSPPQVSFSVSKSFTLSHEHPLMCRK